MEKLIMVKFNVSVVGLALLGLVSYAVMSPSSGGFKEVDSKENVITLKSDYNQQSMEEMIQKLREANEDKGEDERILLEVYSPGGSVFAGRRMFAELENGLPVDTYVSSFAASMGANTFLKGENRYMAPDALILFHGASMGGLTVVDFADMLQVLKSKLFIDTYTKKMSRSSKYVSKVQALRNMKSLKSEKLDYEVTPSQMAYFDTLMKKALNQGYDKVVRGLEGDFLQLATLNNQLVDRFNPLIEASNGKLTREIVIRDIFQNFERDVYLTAQQALEYGIATHIGVPNFDTYKAY